MGLLRVALTGGIGTGKSYCLRRFEALGVPVVDADVLAREAVAPDSPGLAAVVARFGATVRTAEGTLDREALADRIFGDPAARRDLEAIVHPIVYQRLGEWFEAQSKCAGSHSSVAIADIPLLYETGRAADFDRVIVAACPVEQQLGRLALRGYSDLQARQRLESQLPIAEKVRQAHYVIDTSGPTSETDRQVVEVWEKLKAEASQAARLKSQASVPPPSRYS